MSGDPSMPSGLVASDFADYYQAVHGYEPFPWQQTLTETVLEDGGWPQLVDVPTGLGKTSLLDIAVFVAAATADQVGSGRVGRRRCLFVVDRRVVVDEATEHAAAINGRLREAEAAAAVAGLDSVLLQVASGLRRLGGTARGDGDPLTVTRMRGGTTWSSAWAERPDRPGIVIGTVDQVGSRLLFRGYGVGDRRRPIEAALVGTDALLLVDEAHLATSLLRTLRAAGERDRCALPLPGLSVVMLTATARREPGLEQSATGSVDGTFPLDVPAHLAVPEATRRLTGAKDLRLLQVPVKQVVTAMADLVGDLVGQRSSAGDAPLVLVVCNTVDRAREVHVALAARATPAAQPRSFDVDLLIGRSRPVDRAGLEQRVKQQFRVDARRGQLPAVLVSTQTVEVGVNLDVDALVSESASWDALVQRLGRLNRLGHYAQRFPGSGAAVAVVVHDGQADGPVYGAARDQTWQYLSGLAPPVSDPSQMLGAEAPRGIGVSPMQCRELSSAMPEEAFMRAPESPIVTIPILDRWVCTAPVPTVDPPIEAYLHGFDSGSPTVSVAWRQDLAAQQRSVDLDTGTIGARSELVNDLLTAIPLRAGEQIEVPLTAVRRWASGERPGLVSDLDAAPDGEVVAKQERDAFAVWVLRDDPQTGNGWRETYPEYLRPGDVVVVPCEYGGVDGYGWHPSATDPAVDVSEAAAVDAGRLLLRLDGTLSTRLGLPSDAALDDAVAAIERALAGDADQPIHVAVNSVLQRLRQRLSEALTTERPGVDSPDAAIAEPAWRHPTRLRSLHDLVDQALAVDGSAALAPQCVAIRDADASGSSPDSGPSPIVILSWHPPRGQVATAVPGLDRDDDDPSSSSISADGGRVTLEQHLTNVRARAIEIAECLGLGDELTAVLADAARWHDLGKVDDRFQAMLHGGDPCEALVAEEPLAKSGMNPDDRGAWRTARKRSELPPGARHEAWSAALVRKYLSMLCSAGQPYGGDADLLLHLVASHHGHARPLLPLVVDDEPRDTCFVVDDVEVHAWSADTVDLDHPERFANLNERYGRWGLALLETVVRCADMTVSAEGS